VLLVITHREETPVPKEMTVGGIGVSAQLASGSSSLIGLAACAPDELVQNEKSRKNLTQKRTTLEEKL